MFLRSIRGKYNVLTDPVSGYTLRALTQHIYSGAKFYTIDWGGFKRFNFDNYSLKKYKKYDDWLFIINQRDGALSETGRISRHWHEGELQLHRYYRGGLVEFVDAHPEVFRKIWSQDRISVFRISFGGQAADVNSNSIQ